MADFDVSRFRTTSFMTIWDLLKEVLVNMVKWFDGTTDTNLPVGTKRWSSSNKRFEQWDGSTWGELLPVADSASAYQIRVAMANACSGSTATADLATNAQNLGGVAASQYVQTTDTRMSDSRKCNGQFDSAGTARTALSVYSKTEMDNSMALKAPVLNPAFSGTPTAPTAAAGASTTQIATTEFVGLALQSLAQIKSFIYTYNGIYPIQETGDVPRSRAVVTLPFTPKILFIAVEGKNTPYTDYYNLSEGTVVVSSTYDSFDDITYNPLDASGQQYTVLAFA